MSVENKNALNRKLCTAIIIIAFTDTVSKPERDHIALQLIKKYPCLKGTVGAGHVSAQISSMYIACPSETGLI